MTKPESETYNFTLVLAGATAVTPKLVDALYEAGCDDALFYSTEGLVCLEFDREGFSLQDAILSAIEDVEKTDLRLRVVRVEPDELVTTAEIGNRIGQSRESIRLYATGDRGPGDFPPPVSGVTRKAPLYRWTDVASWIADKLKGLFSPPPALDQAHSIGAINAALDLRRLTQSKREAQELMASLAGLTQVTGKPRRKKRKRTTKTATTAATKPLAKATKKSTKKVTKKTAKKVAKKATKWKHGYIQEPAWKRKTAAE